MVHPVLFYYIGMVTTTVSLPFKTRHSIVKQHVLAVASGLIYEHEGKVEEGAQHHEAIYQAI